ncbi:MAG: hypothetical protein FJX61_08820 [Alphaproteobacteria bacterium]|nr:hypothetical protein [Alphaproteobacteria bacterium]
MASDELAPDAMRRTRPDDPTTIEASRRVRDIVGRGRIDVLQRRRDLPGIVYLIGHLAVLAASGALVWQAHGSLWLVPAMFVHGTIIAHLFAPFHECAHATAFASRRLNAVVWWATGLALILPLSAFRYEHADHHTYTQNLERDPQMIPIGESLGGYLYYVTSIPYFVGVFRNLIGQPFGWLPPETARAVPPAARRQVVYEAHVFWAFYLALATASVVLESWAVVLYWLGPRLIGEPLERIIRMAEHVGCARSPNMLENTRTVFVAAPIRWLAWNMAYHTAHHAIPQVPFHALPALTAALAGHLRETRRGYVDTVVTHLKNVSARRWPA